MLRAAWAKHVAIAISLVSVGVTHARTAAAGDPAVAREQLKIGYTLAEQGKCDEAIPHLAESLRLDPKAITLINLADCEEKVGKLADAMGHWVDARARAQTEGAQKIEEEAEKRAKDLEPRLARLTIVLAATAPRDATVERDGIVLGAPSLNIPLPLDPGAHTVVVKARGRPDGTTSITLGEGESKRIEVDVGAGAAPSGAVGDAPKTSPSPLVFVGFGVAAVGAVVGAVTGVVALGAGSDADKACPSGVCANQQALDDAKAGQTMGTVSTIAFIVAGVGAGVGVYGLLTGSKAKKSDPSVGVSLLPTYVGLRGRF